MTLMKRLMVSLFILAVSISAFAEMQNKQGLNNYSKNLNSKSAILTYGFEDGNFPPEGWTTVDADGDSYNWGTTTSAHTGDMGIASASYVNDVGAVTPDNWIISSKFVKPEKVSYWVGAIDPDWPNEKYGIYVSTTDTEISSFTEIFSETLASADWKEKEIDLSAYSNEETVYLAIRHYDCTDNFYIVFDDITVWAADTFAPVITATSGKVAYVGEDMTIQITVDDSSNLDSTEPVIATYTIADGTETALIMTEVTSKGQTVFTGTIPSENSITSGVVKFTLKDEHGNTNSTPYEYEIAWEEPPAFFDSFEDGAEKWILDGSWAVTDESAYDGTYSLTESPGGNYAANINISATIADPIDLSGDGIYGATLSFWTEYSIEEGAEFDNLFIEASADGGTNWDVLKFLEGEGVAWHEETVDVSGYVGSSDFKFRFRFYADGGYETSGCYIDNVKLELADVDTFAPQIVYTVPTTYEATMSDYTFTAELRDPSGISETSVIYTVDGGDETTVAGVLTGEVYSYTIPAQPAGSVVKYKISATDNAPALNVAESQMCEIVTGTHLIYDSNIVSYYTTIEPAGATADAQLAIAVLASVPQFKGKAAELKGVAIRFYEDVSGHQSGEAAIRVFKDNGQGLPGEEITTEPVLFTPDHNGFHYIDMRDYNIKDIKNFYVALFANTTTVYSTTERPSEDGMEDHFRAYTLVTDGTNQEWQFTADTNYMIRPVIGETYDLGNEELIPEKTALLQNYPNPFNPTTSINYSIVNNGHVELTVYNVKGQEVAKLINGQVKAGLHSVNFNAAKFNSGVYYYKLKADNKVMTKKMILVK